MNSTDTSPRFESLALIEPLLKALHQEGYTQPTPIQRQAIPHVLEGRDLLGCAQTGTGKTAAFALPILQRLSADSQATARRKIRCLVLTPTRELAAQIEESFERYGANLGLTTTVIFGGVGQGAQVSALRKGVDILVATPGRLLDLIDQGHVSFSDLKIFVLDEADRMLDMGFIHDVKRVLKLIPKQRQSLFFSATMPPDIQRLANEILSNPVKVEVTPVATTAEKIDQSVYMVDSKEGKRFLLQHLMQDAAVKMALVFTRTKHGADRVTRYLNAAGITAEAIHGNKSQNNRVRALDNFKRGDTRVLVATDIAARGIDIDGVTHVINYELPNIPETYVHRIGRTARAGAEGKSFSFCDQEEREYLRDIERLIRQKIRVETNNPYASGVYVPTKPEKEEARPPRQGGGGGGRGRPQSRPQGRGAPRSDRGESRPSGERSAAPRPSAFAGNARSTENRRPERSSAEARPQQARSGQSRPAPAGRTSRPEGSRSASGNASSNTSRGSGQQASPSSSSGGKSRGRRGGRGRGGGGGSRSEGSTRSDSSAASTPEKKSWWKRLTGSNDK
jgi:ATP-dependent RNA helicase RhlE